MNAASKSASKPERKLSILIADDEQDAVTTLAAILEDEGHIVHTVTHGGLVMQALRRFDPEVCILDIQMPGRDGYDVAREITHARESTGHGPVLIAISGKWTTQTDRMLAKMVGFDHFLAKPANPAELVAILDTISGTPKDVA